MVRLMRLPALAAALTLIAAAVFSDVRAQTPSQQPAASGHPVVLELYTSQGCSACPRANRLVAQFARDPDVVALTFPVGYWDYLGWTDTFAQPQFASRQRDYARKLQFHGAFTPQLILDGARQMSPDDWDEVRSAVNEERARPPHEGEPRVTITRSESGRVRVNISGEAVRAMPADIWLLSYEPGPLVVWVQRGDNANRTVLHYNLVSAISRVGQWNGAPLWFERTRCSPQCAVLLQEQNGGPILAAAMTRRETR